MLLLSKMWNGIMGLNVEERIGGFGKIVWWRREGDSLIGMSLREMERINFFDEFCYKMVRNGIIVKKEVELRGYFRKK